MQTSLSFSSLSPSHVHYCCQILQIKLFSKSQPTNLQINVIFLIITTTSHSSSDAFINFQLIFYSIIIETSQTANFIILFSLLISSELSYSFTEFSMKSLNYFSRCSFRSVQFSSVAQSCLTLFDPMNHSRPGLHVHHQLPEFTQTHIHQDRDAIQPSHHRSSPSPPAPNPSQDQSLFQ